MTTVGIFVLSRGNCTRSQGQEPTRLAQSKKTYRFSLRAPRRMLPMWERLPQIAIIPLRTRQAESLRVEVPLGDQAAYLRGSDAGDGRVQDMVAVWEVPRLGE